MTDNDPMPSGKYKGEAMANVPADHLLWLYNNNKAYGKVKEYIIENLDLLKHEAKNNINKNTRA